MSDKPLGEDSAAAATNSEASASAGAATSNTQEEQAQKPQIIVTITPKEVLEKALQDFVLLDNKELNPHLKEVLENIAITGRSLFPWDSLRSLVSFQLTLAAAKYPNAKDSSESLQRVIGALNNFDEAPFTLQRIVELAINPEKFYKTPRKFFFALEKLVNVITTVPVWDPSQETNDDETMGDVPIPEAVFIDEGIINTAEVVPMDVVG